jgi:biotin carboxylase
MRRNKYNMGEAVRSAGVRAVLQQRCTSAAEVTVFARSLAATGKKMVVKPTLSAGSDDVFLCNDTDECLTAFNRILGKVNGLGNINAEVLVQEFMEGKEYVIDQVSRYIVELSHHPVHELTLPLSIISLDFS